VYLDGCMQPDHLVVHPDPAKNELWAACNSTYDNIVVGMGDTKNVSQNPPDYGRGGAYVKDHIPPLNGGGSHNGAFVKYTVSGSTWTGELLSDLGGFHGSAIQTKADVMAGKIPIGK
jgi:hypothetical protein